jgi:hypothetical protein
MRHVFRANKSSAVLKRSTVEEERVIKKITPQRRGKFHTEKQRGWCSLTYYLCALLFLSRRADLHATVSSPAHHMRSAQYRNHLLKTPHGRRRSLPAKIVISKSAAHLPRSRVEMEIMKPPTNSFNIIVSNQLAGEEVFGHYKCSPFLFDLLHGFIMAWRSSRYAFLIRNWRRCSSRLTF